MEGTIDYIRKEPNGGVSIGNMWVDVKPQSELRITPQFVAKFSHPMPNWWFRLWYRLLLGWVWKKVG